MRFIKKIFNNVSPQINRAQIIRVGLIAAACCVILLIGILVGLLTLPKKDAKSGVPDVAAVAPPKEKRTSVSAFSPLDPVSGDWGISPYALADRMNVTLDEVGARSSIIKKISTPSDSEFRYVFSPSLIMLGEIAPNGNIVRAALFFDPVFSQIEYSNALAVIRAIIAAIDPSLDRDAIFAAQAKLGLSQTWEFPPDRQSEVRLGKFALRLWSVAGSAFVFTASSI